MPRLLLLAVLLAVAPTLAGCGDTPRSPQTTKPKEFRSNDHDHSDHSRDDAMLEDVTLPDGTKCHAGLTAHLDPQGNELDIFFESFDKTPKPVPIPAAAKLTARVTRAGDDRPYTLEFQPAPASERPGDPDGHASRFSAPAPWMQPKDKLTVVVSIEHNGKLQRVTFLDFVPEKHAHRHTK